MHAQYVAVKASWDGQCIACCVHEEFTHPWRAPSVNDGTNATTICRFCWSSIPSKAPTFSFHGISVRSDSMASRCATAALPAGTAEELVEPVASSVKDPSEERPEVPGPDDPDMERHPSMVYVTASRSSQIAPLIVPDFIESWKGQGFWNALTTS